VFGTSRTLGLHLSHNITSSHRFARYSVFNLVNFTSQAYIAIGLLAAFHYLVTITTYMYAAEFNG